MAQIPEHTLLSRINEEIRGGAVTVPSLSRHLREDINDTVTDVNVKNQGLKSIHKFLLPFIPLSAREHFKWPE